MFQRWKTKENLVFIALFWERHHWMKPLQETWYNAFVDSLTLVVF